MDNKATKYKILNYILVALIAICTLSCILQEIIAVSNGGTSLFATVYTFLQFAVCVMVILYSSDYQSKNYSPAFFRGMLILSTATITYRLSSEILIYSAFTNTNNSTRNTVVMILVMFFSLSALFIGLVASRLSNKKRNKILLAIAPVFEFGYTITTLVSGEISVSSFSDVFSIIVTFTFPIALLCIFFAYVTGAYTRSLEREKEKEKAQETENKEPEANQ